MKKSKICKVLILATALILMVAMVGCERQAQKVSYNISLEADNFNIIRKVIVINGINNDVVFQVQGRISIELPNRNKLEITAQHGPKDYRKHFVLLGDNDTVLVEDTGLGKNDVSNYQYTVNFNPKMWIPINVKHID